MLSTVNYSGAMEATLFRNSISFWCKNSNLCGFKDYQHSHFRHGGFVGDYLAKPTWVLKEKPALYADPLEKWELFCGRSSNLVNTLENDPDP